MAKKDEAVGEETTEEEVETQTEEVESNEPKKIVLTEVFKPIMEAGVSDKDDAVDKALEYLQSKGQTHNIRGNPITKESLGRHFSNIVRDITTERKGWWSGYEIVEEENSLIWRKKE